MGFWDHWGHIKYFLETFVIEVFASLFADIKLAINVNMEAHLIAVRMA